MQMSIGRAPLCGRRSPAAAVAVASRVLWNSATYQCFRQSLKMPTTTTTNTIIIIIFVVVARQIRAPSARTMQLPIINTSRSHVAQQNVCLLHHNKGAKLKERLIDWRCPLA